MSMATNGCQIIEMHCESGTGTAILLDASSISHENAHQNHIKFRVRQNVFIAQSIAYQIRHVNGFIGQKDQHRRHVTM